MEDNHEIEMKEVDRGSEENAVDDMSEWTYPEWVAILCHYTGYPFTHFSMAPETTPRVARMQEKYPKSGYARPMSMGVMFAKTRAAGAQIRAHPTDVTPLVQGTNFATVTVPEESTAVAYTAPRAVEVVADLLQQVEGDVEVVKRTPPAIVCRYGVASTGQDCETTRKQRVASVCQSLLKPDSDNGGYQPAMTVTSLDFERESLVEASVKLGVACSAYTGKTVPGQLYDQMLEQPATYAFIAHTVGAGLQDTAYQKCTDEQHCLTEVAEPLEYRKFKDPIAIVKALEPAVRETKMDGMTANMVDGLPVTGPLRVCMNDLADVQIPLGATIVYLDQPSRELAKQVFRREKHIRRVVFYRTEIRQDNNVLIDDHLKVTVKNGKVVTEVVHVGVIPYYGEFKSPDPAVTIYVNLNRTDTVFNTHEVQKSERRKYDKRPEAKWYLMGVHVYSLDPGLYAKGAENGPKFDPNFYVSRDFQACKVINTNYLVPGLTKFGRYRILDVFVHIMRCAIAYPITRAVCSVASIDGEVVNLISKFAYYPFGGEEEMKRLQRRFDEQC